MAANGGNIWQSVRTFLQRRASWFPRIMAQSDDSRWFVEEVQPHEPLLRAYLHRAFPSLSDLDDVVQESHLQMLKAREKGSIKSSAKAYLFSVARNVAFGVFRARRRHPEIAVNEVPVASILEEARDGAEHASIQQEFGLAMEAIDRLPGRCREIVTLRAVRGLSHKEIAAKLELSEDTVRVQVARGMKKCAQYLRERGIDGTHQR